ncbi:7-cyano-7-deazaguanine synthase QueC [Coxiella burnetii]|nr:7-cyano-7-deazaguanine synthase QueC [Coxiella burnetii]NP_821053.2 queuosine biosynthesis protein [Coxiella burnetii RSA 493]AAO91567.2 queuosine biosynthesis protein [Coxiella burnetii RSA 493]ARI66823.1 7-cyano-7-deazaguanine synthase [Coxiella burnetii]AZV74711.1 7-cyano-7-deazaguanine synthase QueC [Coxiella burnetii]OYK83443.1 7-cyano-7-deazaguanine synthase QueC [Coxiella burnetii]OYK87260.1 7-cyano-7-deazaguanine synthase QueC [Coxiella burnetii]
MAYIKKKRYKSSMPQRTYMKKAVILISGGLDSTTCLAVAKSKGFSCYALSFDYGQKHHSELVAAEKIAAHFNVVRYEVVTLSIGKLGGSALTDNSLDVPDYGGNESIPITYVPARNTIFLSIALGWAEILDAESILIGASAIDYSGYPDCRPEYIAAFQNLANLATKRGIEGHSIKIEAPLIHLSKAETIKLGYSLGVDYSMTVSCYRANEEGLACGYCDSCELRKKGFKEAEIKDPTQYITKV